MAKKPEIVVVSVAHTDEYISETLEGLSKAGVEKGTLVLVETPESNIKNPSKVPEKYKNWVLGVNFFVADRKAHISSLEPDKISNVRSVIMGITGKDSSSSMGFNFGAESIMSDIISQKAGARKKVVAVIGASHGSRISDILHEKGFRVKVINAVSPYVYVSPKITYHISKRDALLRGYGRYNKFGKMKDIKPTQLEKMRSGKSGIEKLKWKMPTTFRFGENGKLVPLKGRRTRKH